ncbi:AHH domain-containing protein [Pseudomonas sp. HN11]|uniref:AHH domain-containing protein n=1 Tax=Pseudomonas sp. HN11 TaxID=1344094 RepID=UPI0022776AFD|nr:AHH domain-containing protein [Pseudomonas sp. HN11]
MGAREGDGIANHHLIPEELIKHKEFGKMFSRLKKIGWDPDGASNGAFLPGSKDLAAKTQLPGHWSNHNKYTDAVRDRLSAYKVKAKIKELKADLMIEELLATDAVLNICATLEIPHITRQVEIELKEKKHLKNATTFSFRPPDSACLILSIRYSPSTATNTPANSRHQKKVMYPLSFLSPSNHSR